MKSIFAVISEKTACNSLCMVHPEYEEYYQIPMKLQTLNSPAGSNSQLGERTERLEYTIKKLIDVAKDLKELKKSADEVNATRLKKLGKRYFFFFSLG